MKTNLSYQELAAHCRSWERAGRANFVLKHIAALRYSVVCFGPRAAWFCLSLFAILLYLTGPLVFWPWILFGCSMVCFAAVFVVVVVYEIVYRVRSSQQNVWSLDRNVVITEWEPYENQFPEHASRLAMLSPAACQSNRRTTVTRLLSRTVSQTPARSTPAPPVAATTTKSDPAGCGESASAASDPKTSTN